MAYTNRQVTYIIGSYQSDYDGKFWNEGLRNEALSANNWGVTDTPCPDDDENCTSNVFGAATGVNNPSQCYGFSLFMAYVIFGDYIEFNEIYNATHGDIISNNWIYCDENLSSVELEPGDIIRTATHSAMVWKIENSKVKVIECWGSVGCKIHFGNFNGDDSAATLSTLLNNAVYILKAPKNRNTGCC